MHYPIAAIALASLVGLGACQFSDSEVPSSQELLNQVDQESRNLTRSLDRELFAPTGMVNRATNTSASQLTSAQKAVSSRVNREVAAFSSYIEDQCALLAKTIQPSTSRSGFTKSKVRNKVRALR